MPFCGGNGPVPGRRGGADATACLSVDTLKHRPSGVTDGRTREEDMKPVQCLRAATTGLIGKAEQEAGQIREKAVSTLEKVRSRRDRIVEQQKEQLRKRLEGLRDRLSRRAQEIDRLHHFLDGKQEEIDKSKEGVNSLKGRIGNLRGDGKRLRGEIRNGLLDRTEVREVRQVDEAVQVVIEVAAVALVEPGAKPGLAETPDDGHIVFIELRGRLEHRRDFVYSAAVCEASCEGGPAAYGDDGIGLMSGERPAPRYDRTLGNREISCLQITFHKRLLVCCKINIWFFFLG